MKPLNQPIQAYDGLTPVAPIVSAISFTGAVVTPFPGGVQVAITGTSGGTVTSVGLALPVSVFTVTGSPVVGAGTLTGSFVVQTANRIFAGPATGVPAVPTFRALVAADITFLVKPALVDQIPVYDTTTSVIGSNAFKFVVASRNLQIRSVAAGTVTNVGTDTITQVFQLTGTTAIPALRSLVNAYIEDGTTTIAGNASQFGIVSIDPASITNVDAETSDILINNEGNTEIELTDLVSVRVNGIVSNANVAQNTIRVNQADGSIISFDGDEVGVDPSDIIIEEGVADPNFKPRNILLATGTDNAGANIIGKVRNSISYGDTNNILFDYSNAGKAWPGFLFGEGLTTYTPYEVIIGKWATLIASGDPFVFATSNSAFRIGNGTGSGSRSDAFRINNGGRIISFGGRKLKSRDAGSVTLDIETDHVIAQVTAGAKTYTLPVGENGTEFIILADGSGDITLTASGGNVVLYNGSSAISKTITIATTYKIHLIYISSISTWHVTTSSV